MKKLAFLDRGTHTGGRTVKTPRMATKRSEGDSAFTRDVSLERLPRIGYNYGENSHEKLKRGSIEKRQKVAIRKGNIGTESK